jgi:hypothetical protein
VTVVPAGSVRFSGDTGAEADYIVFEMAWHLLVPDWLAGLVKNADSEGIERSLPERPAARPQRHDPGLETVR